MHNSRRYAYAYMPKPPEYIVRRFRSRVEADHQAEERGWARLRIRDRIGRSIAWRLQRAEWAEDETRV